MIFMILIIRLAHQKEVSVAHSVKNRTGILRFELWHMTQNSSLFQASDKC